jgi:Zn finger protein HypA/HybF involved in hydrogenase expression
MDYDFERDSTDYKSNGMAYQIKPVTVKCISCEKDVPWDAVTWNGTCEGCRDERNDWRKSMGFKEVWS